jgi:hypothetical protein
MGCDVMLRDHNGGFILSASEGLGGFQSLELAEAIAVSTCSDDLSIPWNYKGSACV